MGGDVDVSFVVDAGNYHLAAAVPGVDTVHLVLSGYGRETLLLN